MSEDFWGVEALSCRRLTDERHATGEIRKQQKEVDRRLCSRALMNESKAGKSTSTAFLRPRNSQGGPL